MAQRFDLAELQVDVAFKDIKNVHLSVYPPNGRVHISAPSRMNLDTIRVYAISKLDWIRRQQRKVRAQARETPREYLDRESHFVWGKRYLLQLIDVDGAASVELNHSQILLSVRPGAGVDRCEEVLGAWYREQIRNAARPLIAKWEQRLEVSVGHLFVQRMRTRWGSCNPKRGSIRLKTELAKKPPECLEYVVVHEMAHLLVPNHGDRFMAVLDRSLPGWRQVRQTLNSAPLAHEDWTL